MSAQARRLATAAFFVACALWVYQGWQVFYFWTDDAFIAFRYAANAVAGDGLVWNAPPFVPVEGYTSFLWVALLAAIWSATGIEPPSVANGISLLFGYATLAMGVRLIARFELPERLARVRVMLCALVVLGTIINRTFLTWLSSGLETSLFNFGLTWWVAEAVTRDEKRSPMWVFRLTLASALAALTRPDGLLAVAGTAAVLADPLWRHPSSRRLRWLAAGWPLLLVPAHLLFRRVTYGEWLPNTYHAKFIGAWPESGWRYAASFALENGTWVWLAIACAWSVAALRVRARVTTSPCIVVVAVLTAHWGYYTWIIGGDHFEYRVYSHLILLLLVSAVWMMSRLTDRPLWVAAAITVLAIASLPIPFRHWIETRSLETREATHLLAQPVAQHFSKPVGSLVAHWDAWQRWLIEHHVGIRHQEHKIFFEYLTNRLPSRAEGSKIGDDDRPVTATNAVGVVGWVFPNVAVIDTFGLNDRIIAKTPLAPGRTRLMAHDRQPPPGYVACFRPNLATTVDPIRWTTRGRPLTDADIRSCESRSWD